LKIGLKQFLNYLYIPILICFLILGVHIFVSITNIELGYYGIYPRRIEGLRGVVFAPFIHGSWQHVFSNTVPMFLLTTMIEYFYKRVARAALTIIWLLTGILVWLFARDNTFHIGASGVVYGLISFVFSSGLFRGNSRSVVLSLLVLVMYGGYFEGLAPKEGISWESHLYGAITGLVVAFVFKNIKEEGEEEDKNDEPKSVRRAFFGEDTFLITKVEKARILEAQRLANLLELQRIAQEEARLKESNENND
jgi:membrane associated rhomboid family serine protease